MALSLSTLVLYLLASSAGAALIVTPEIHVASPRYVTGTFSVAGIGSDGDSFLLVGPTSSDSPRARLVAMRVRATGELLDPTGIALDSAVTEYRELPTIAVRWTGAEYLVTWSRVTDQGFTTYARRVSREGDVSPLETVTTVRGDRVYALVASATRYLQLYEISHRLYGILYDSNLREIRRAFPVPGGSGQGNAAAGSDGESFLVAWENFVEPGFEVMATRLGAEGDPLEHAGLVLDSATAPYLEASSPPNAVVHWNGARYVVAWHDRGIEARTVDRFGMLGASARLFEVGIGVTRGIAMTSDGNRTLITWIHTIDNPLSCAERHYSLHGAFLDSGAAAIDRGVLDSSSGCDIFPEASAIKVAGGKIAISWPRRSFVLSEVTSLSTAIPHDIPVAFSATRQYQPAVASNGDLALIAWNEAGSVTYRGPFSLFSGDKIRATRYRGGVSLDGEGIVLSPVGADQIRPAVAVSGELFLVTWMHLIRPNIHQVLYEVHGRRVAADGTVLDAADLVLSDASAVAQRIVWNGSRFLLVWSDRRNLWVTEVTPSGEVIRHPAPEGTANTTTDFEAAASGSETLVIWSTVQAGQQNADVVAMRLNASGHAIDTTPLTIANSPDAEFPRAVTDTENGWLVTWVRSSDLRAAAVGRDGSVSSEKVITDSPALSALATSRDSFLLLLNAGGSLTAISLTPSLDVGDSRSLSVTEFNDVPAVAAHGRGFLVTYSRAAPEQLYGGVSRVFAREVMQAFRRRATRR